MGININEEILEDTFKDNQQLLRDVIKEYRTDLKELTDNYKKKVDENGVSDDLRQEFYSEVNNIAIALRYLRGKLESLGK